MYKKIIQHITIYILIIFSISILINKIAKQNFHYGNLDFFISHGVIVGALLGAVYLTTIFKMDDTKKIFGKINYNKFSTWLLILTIIGGIVSCILTSIVGLNNNLIDISKIIEILIVVSIVAYNEEMLFRGIIQSKLPKNNIKSMLIVGVGFGLLHLPNFLWGAQISDVFSQVITTTLAGFTYFALREKSESLILVIMLHAIYDGTLLIGVGANYNSIFFVTYAVILLTFGFIIYIISVLMKKPQT